MSAVVTKWWTELNLIEACRGYARGVVDYEGSMSTKFLATITDIRATSLLKVPVSSVDINKTRSCASTYMRDPPCTHLGYDILSIVRRQVIQAAE